MLEKPNQGALSLPNANLAKLEHLRRLSHLWDESLRVPGTKFRVGLESVMGLLPFGGYRVHTSLPRLDLRIL